MVRARGPSRASERVLARARALDHFRRESPLKQRTVATGGDVGVGYFEQ